MSQSTITASEAVAMLDRESKAHFARGMMLREKNVDDALVDGDILGPLRFVDGTHKDSFWLETAAYYVRFRVGDSIELKKVGNVGADTVADDLTIKGVVFSGIGTVRLEVTRAKKLEPDYTADYFAYPKISDLDLLVKRCISGNAGATARLDFSHPKIEFRENDATGLNDSQVMALKEILNRGLSGCVQGPPGTGKTQLLSAIVAHAIANNLRIGITALTHTAVDNALSRICRVANNIKIARASSNKARVAGHLYSTDFVLPDIVDGLGRVKSHHQIVAATAHSWIMTKHRPSIDVLIIDEAGQVASYLAPILFQISRRVIMLGDDCQLPPVLTARHAHVPIDIFTLARAAMEPPMLEVQYRMNERIQEWSSETHYRGRLRPDSTNAQRDVLSTVRHSILGEVPVQLRTHSSPMLGAASMAEAAMVATLIKSLLKDAQLEAKDIGVVTPFRMQAGAVCAELQASLGLDLGSAIQVDTVERFQGQEREVMLLSFGSPSRSSNDINDLEFVSDTRRLNVAVTRSKSRFYCFASDGLVRSANENHRSAALAGFINWCGAVKRLKGVA